MPASPQGELLPFKVRDRRDPGWHWNQNEIVDTWGAIIGGRGIAIYTVLSRFSRDNQVELSWAKIKHHAGFSRSTVFRTLRQLEDLGLLGCRQRPGEANTYFLV